LPLNFLSRRFSHFIEDHLFQLPEGIGLRGEVPFCVRIPKQRYFSQNDGARNFLLSSFFLRHGFLLSAVNHVFSL